jgi:hypothetical protein
MTFFKRLFGQGETEGQGSGPAQEPARAARLPRQLEAKLQQALADAAEKKSEARFLTSERLRPILACVANQTGPEGMAAALEQAAPMSVAYWLLLWPLIEAAAGTAPRLDAIAVQAAGACLNLADEGNVLESFGIYVKSTARQKEMSEFVRLALQHTERCAADARAHGRAAMVLGWLGKDTEARAAFEQALKTANADSCVINMVREGKPIDSWYPVTPEVRTILGYWQRTGLGSG